MALSREDLNTLGEAEQDILKNERENLQTYLEKNSDYKRLNFGNGLPEYEKIIALLTSKLPK